MPGSSDALRGRTAIVTGGGRGLGRAMALGLAAQGASVVITAANGAAELAAVSAEAGGDAVHAVLADIRDPEASRRVVDGVMERHGRLDMLVNNAARGMRYVSERFMTEPTRFWETPPDIWRMVMETNVNGPFNMARAAVPAMLAAGRGRIVNIAINHATMRRAGFSPYGPSKAALDAMTAIWAQDLQGTGITVNALLPGGATLTGMIPESVAPELKERLLRPDIIVPPLLWLASDASHGVTGMRFDASKWDRGAPATAGAEPL